MSASQPATHKQSEDSQSAKIGFEVPYTFYQYNRGQIRLYDVKKRTKKSKRGRPVEREESTTTGVAEHAESSAKMTGGALNKKNVAKYVTFMKPNKSKVKDEESWAEWWEENIGIAKDEWQDYLVPSYRCTPNIYAHIHALEKRRARKKKASPPLQITEHGEAEDTDDSGYDSKGDSEQDRSRRRLET